MSGAALPPTDPVDPSAGPVVLALDCSAAACSVALWRGGGVAAHRFEPMGRGQAEALMPMVDAVMTAAGVGYAALDLVAATVGPGSFTGLRIGLAAARGLALAAGVPALGVTSFAAIAAAVTAPGSGLAVAIDDRRGGVYWQEFDRAGDSGGGPATRGAPMALGPEDLAPAVAARLAAGGRLAVAGDGAALLRAALAGAERDGRVTFVDPAGPPDAAQVARIAAGLAAGGTADLAAGLAPVPLYLRPPDARLPDAGHPRAGHPGAGRR